MGCGRGKLLSHGGEHSNGVQRAKWRDPYTEDQCRPALNSLRHAVCSLREVVPVSRDPGSGGLHSLLGGEVRIVTCACTQDSWWLQQQC